MAENPSSASPEPSRPSFEQALASLETIVHELEDGQIGLEQSLSRYEEGVKLLRHCHGLLQSAERKIELLTKVDATGQATTEPFDDSPTASQNAENTAPRSRRRSVKSAKSATNGPEDSGEIDTSGSLF